MSEPAKQYGLVLGIDLGTTNSLAAVMTPHGARVVRDRDGQALIPSVVSFLPGGGVVVGREARGLMLELPDRTVYSIKRLIGRAGAEVDDEARRLPYPVVQGPRGLARVRIDRAEHSPEEISALILRKVKETAEQALATEVGAVVITVPAYFDDAQRQATKHAAELAGLRCLRIVNEPTSASLAYGIAGNREGNVLVYDLGGGTFDVSILRIQDCVFRVLATAGDTHLGGDDFDRLLVDRILAMLTQRTGRAPEEIDPWAMQVIRRSAESLKILLSSQESAALQLETGKGETVELTVTRSELEEQIGPLVERTLDCCRRAMADAGLAFAEIDDVVLVGGSTRIPMVRRELQELTGKSPHTEVDPDHAVALGAAIQGDILAGARSALLLDVIPLSLGIETMGGVVSKLILRNSTIPASHTEEFSTQADNQTGVDINIYQGEREKVDHCRKLGAFKLTGIPAAPAGLPRIAVTFLVDADGVLRVTAKELRTGIEAGIQVVPSFGLTRDEIRRIMMESIDHAEEDMRAREAVELRNKAQAMVRGTRKALEMADLPPDQTYSVKKAVRAVEQALEKDDERALRGLVEALSRLTAQIADDVVSSAVRKALTGPDR